MRWAHVNYESFSPQNYSCATDVMEKIVQHRNIAQHRATKSKFSMFLFGKKCNFVFLLVVKLCDDDIYHPCLAYFEGGL